MISIPNEFFHVQYDRDRHPESATFELGRGANCQLFAYALLAHHGLHVPPLRSKELWEDQKSTVTAATAKPLDILLFNRSLQPFGAHLAICNEEGHVIHLSKEVGKPEIRPIADMLKNPKYRVLVGIKRVVTFNR